MTNLANSPLPLFISLSFVPPSLAVKLLCCFAALSSSETCMRRTWREPSHWRPKARSLDRRRSSEPQLEADENHAYSHGFWPFLAPSDLLSWWGQVFWNELSVLHKIMPPLTDESSPFKSQLLFISWLPRLFPVNQESFMRWDLQKFNVLLIRFHLIYILTMFWGHSEKHILWDRIVNLNVVSICV